MPCGGGASDSMFDTLLAGAPPRCLHKQHWGQDGMTVWIISRGSGTTGNNSLAKHLSTGPTTFQDLESPPSSSFTAGLETMGFSWNALSLSLLPPPGDCFEIPHINRADVIKKERKTRKFNREIRVKKTPIPLSG